MKSDIINLEFEVPVFIITDKKEYRTNAFFYQGENIAVVKYGDTEYVLTTGGHYIFNYKGSTYNSEKCYKPLPLFANLRDLTDKKIKTLSEHKLIHRWGYFYIRVWENGKTQDKQRIIDADKLAWSLYDEAMNNFKTYVKNDITADVICGLALTWLLPDKSSGQVFVMPGNTINETKHRKEDTMDEKTYKIVRKYKDSSHPDHDKEIDTGLTREEAKEHCKDPDTQEDGVWFDAFYEED